MKPPIKRSAHFEIVAEGEDANDAFHTAVSWAQDEYGSGWYTGTIAEKTKFVPVVVPDWWSPSPPEDYAFLMLEENDEIRNPQGPAGCIDLGDNQYLFFGWAIQ